MALDIDNTRIWSDSAAEIHQVVVGPMDNNVYVLRCRRSGDGVLIDAANEHDVLLELAQQLGVRKVLETHGHWDHIQAVTEMRDAGYSVGVTSEDASMLPSYDEILPDDDVVTVGHLRLRTIHTPGHTPGSMCFSLEGAPVLFSGDTLFPGGPGNTSFEGGDFPTIITSLEQRLFRPYDSDTLVLPGHGDHTTIGAEAPHLDEWAENVAGNEPALPADQRPIDPTPVHTGALPPTPTRDRNIPAEAWVEAPAALLESGADLPGQPQALYKRRISDWLLWRAGPAARGHARYVAIASDNLDLAYTYRLFPDGSGGGMGPSGATHDRFRTWKEDLRDHTDGGPAQA